MLEMLIALLIFTGITFLLKGGIDIKINVTQTHKYEAPPVQPVIETPVQPEEQNVAASLDGFLKNLNETLGVEIDESSRT